ncbi:807_t:CDS:2, partial [Gigaspora rosea]
ENISDSGHKLEALRGVTCSKKGTIGIVVGNGFTPGAIEEANLSLKNIQLS